MEQQLTNEEIEACRDAFSKFDKDGSGAISDWELRAMLQCEHTRIVRPRAVSAVHCALNHHLLTR